MAVFMLEDTAGSLEVVVFPETFSKYAVWSNQTRCCSCAASSKKTTSPPHRRDRAAADLGAEERTTREVIIHLQSAPQGRTTFEELAELLSRHRGDRQVFSSSTSRARKRPCACARRSRSG